MITEGDTVWFVDAKGGRRRGTVDAVWPDENVCRIGYGDRLAGVYSLDEVEPEKESR